MKKKNLKIRAYAIAGAVPPGPITDRPAVGPIKQAAANTPLSKLPTPTINNASRGGGSIGIGNTINYGDVAMAGIQGVSTIFNQFGSKSTAKTGKEAVMQSVQDITNGAAAGYNIGKNFGPEGALIGAGAGTLVGLVGRKGHIDRNTDFTAEDEYALGSGLIGAFGNRGLRKKIRAMKNAVMNNKAGVQATTRIEDQYMQEDESNAYSMAEGGELPMSLAYLDDGELVETPDGDINKIPEQGKPTDSNLVNIPEGSRILSDSLKVPGTNKTFAQMGEKFMSKRQSKGNDIYAENSRMLNDRNNKMIYDQLFELQEYVKQQKGIKPKTKNLVQAAAKGAQIGEDEFGDIERKVPTIGINYPSSVPSNLDIMMKEGVNTTSAKSALTKSNMKKARKLSSNKSSNLLKGTMSAVEGIAELSPALSNLFETKAEEARANYNPYSSVIKDRMGRRRYDMDPAIRAMKENRAITNYNASRMAPSTGADMAYRLATASNLSKSIADQYAYTSNIQNQYDAEYANMLNNLGQQYVTAQNLYDELNAANRASARNIRRQGLTQLSDYIQRNRLERNKRAIDAAMLDIYTPFLEYGTPRQNLTQLLNMYGR